MLHSQYYAPVADRLDESLAGIASIAAKHAAHTKAQAARARADLLATPEGKLIAQREAAQAEQQAYQLAIMELPESSERPRAAINLAFAYTARSMSIERAKLFLAGLPAEEAPDLQSKGTSMTDPTLKRRVEIAHAAYTHKAAQGDGAARIEATKIAYALRVHNELATPLADALAQSGFDIATLK